MWRQPRFFRAVRVLAPRTYRAALVPLRVGGRSVPLRHFQTSTPLFAQAGTPKAVPNAEGLLEYTLTDVGEGIAECELLQWYVSEGDNVEEFDPVCEIQSDKATVEISSRYKGIVTKLHYGVGDMAKVGAPLMQLKVADWTGPTSSDAPNAPEAPAAPSSPPANTQSSQSTGAPALRGLDFESLRDKVLATPAVRHLAREKKVDLATVPGSGKDGRILKEDLLRFLAGETTTTTTATTSAAAAGAPPSVTMPQPAAAVAADQVVPIRGVKKIMVKTMTAATHVPHFGYSDEFTVDALIALRQQLKPIAEAEGLRLTYMPIIIKAASLALLKFPELNAHTNPECTEIIYRGAHNIGVAMDTGAGLIVPNIKNVQSKSIFDLARELNRLQAAGTSGSLSTEDLTGGTFTLSNIGNIGGTYMSPVVFLPEVAIGALGRFQKVPRFADDGSVVPTTIMNLSWSADHRVVDGATMARFSNTMKKYLEDPFTMLLDTK